MNVFIFMANVGRLFFTCKQKNMFLGSFLRKMPENVPFPAGIRWRYAKFARPSCQFRCDNTSNAAGAYTNK